MQTTIFEKSEIMNFPTQTKTQPELPEGWKWVTIDDIGQTVSGGTPSTAISEYWKDEIAWISPADLSGFNQKYISKGKKSISKLGLENSSAQLMPKGSVLFSSRAPVGYVVIALEELATNQGFKSVVPKKDILSEYIFYYFKSITQLANQVATGTTFKELSGTAFKKLPFPLPPFPIQQAIVVKIEELFSELDQSIASLKTAQQQLKIYRQAVLKWAFEGKLHQGHVPGITIRTGHVQEEILLAAEPEEKYGEVKGESQDLPEGWKWVKIGDICKCIVPNRDKPKSFSGPIKWVTTPNLCEESIKLDYQKINLGLTELETQKYNARVIPTKSVIMTCVGTFGLSAVIDQPVVINQQLHAFLPAERIYPKYLAFCIQINKRYFEAKSTSTTIQYLNKGNCNSMPFPLCPVETQKEIVAAIESRLSVADNLEKSIRQSLDKAEALRQSILKKAFEGKLV